MKNKSLNHPCIYSANLSSHLIQLDTRVNQRRILNLVWSLKIYQVPRQELFYTFLGFVETSICGPAGSCRRAIGRGHYNTVRHLLSQICTGVISIVAGSALALYSESVPAVRSQGKYCIWHVQSRSAERGS